MAVVLIHKTMDGEPVGAWEDQATSYYAPSFEKMQKRARSLLADKGTNVPWDVWADQLAYRTSHVDFWDFEDTNKSAQEILEGERGRFFAE